MSIEHNKFEKQNGPAGESEGVRQEVGLAKEDGGSVEDSHPKRGPTEVARVPEVAREMSPVRIDTSSTTNEPIVPAPLAMEVQPKPAAAIPGNVPESDQSDESDGRPMPAMSGPRNAEPVTLPNMTDALGPLDASLDAFEPVLNELLEHLELFTSRMIKVGENTQAQLEALKRSTEEQLHNLEQRMNNHRS